MAEDDETATARYIASNVSKQLMLKTMFEIIATTAADPGRELGLGHSRLHWLARYVSESDNRYISRI